MSIVISLRAMRLGCVTALLATSSACALRPTPSGSDEANFAGLYAFTPAFETNDFRPCAPRIQASARDTLWWAVLSPGAISTRDSVVRAAAAARAAEVTPWYFVRLFGTVSDTGTYGHLGRSTRAINVIRIDEMRPVKSGDCTAAPR
jgi:hypothetical protein